MDEVITGLVAVMRRLIAAAGGRLLNDGEQRELHQALNVIDPDNPDGLVADPPQALQAPAPAPAAGGFADLSDDDLEAVLAARRARKLRAAPAPAADTTPAGG